jgi:hypothetical protein
MFDIDADLLCDHLPYEAQVLPTHGTHNESPLQHLLRQPGAEESQDFGCLSKARDGSKRLRALFQLRYRTGRLPGIGDGADQLSRRLPQAV